MVVRTRFAPSPTGPLHLGHAFSALFAAEFAQKHGGTFHLRIEDIDRSRARPEWEAQIYDDLSWLGLSWPQPVMRQSDRLPTYRKALQSLWDRGLLYPCTCNRKDILNAISAPQEGADLPTGPDGLIYPGTCRPTEPGPPSPVLPDQALRLNLAAALIAIGPDPLQFTDNETRQTIALKTLPDTIGDIVLARRDMGTSYHLSVVLDDAEQGITDVTRGQDLAEATQIHVLLQRLLKLPTPRYYHHDLIRDPAGKRLAKRDDARAIAKYRAEGASPKDIRALVGL